MRHPPSRATEPTVPLDHAAMVSFEPTGPIDAAPGVGCADCPWWPLIASRPPAVRHCRECPASGMALDEAESVAATPPSLERRTVRPRRADDARIDRTADPIAKAAPGWSLEPHHVESLVALLVGAVFLGSLSTVAVVGLLLSPF